MPKKPVAVGTKRPSKSKRAHTRQVKQAARKASVGTK
jgi:hypothetical protein